MVDFEDHIGQRANVDIDLLAAPRGPIEKEGLVSLHKDLAYAVLIELHQARRAQRQDLRTSGQRNLPDQTGEATRRYLVIGRSSFGDHNRGRTAGLPVLDPALVVVQLLDR